MYAYNPKPTGSSQLQLDMRIDADGPAGIHSDSFHRHSIEVAMSATKVQYQGPVPMSSIHVQYQMFSPSRGSQKQYSRAEALRPPQGCPAARTW